MHHRLLADERIIPEGGLMRASRILCVFVLAALAGGGLCGDRVRVWTDARGRTLEAELLGVESDRVRLRRTVDGEVFSYPLDALSAADQTFIARRGEETPAEPAPATAPKDWPRRVDCGQVEVEIVREDYDNGYYLYRTPHFDLIADARLARGVITEFGRVLEATLEAVRQMPMEWQPRTPSGQERFTARIFAATEDYFANGAPPNSAGVYYHERGEFHVPISSLGVRRGSTTILLDRSGDLSTLIHEITHQVKHHWLPALPLWLVEGTAVYMESIPYRRGEFRFDRRDARAFAAMRYPGIRDYPVLAIDDIMDASPRHWMETMDRDPLKARHFYFSSYLLTYYFLHLDGDGDGAALYRFLRALEAGDSVAEAEQLLLDGRTREQLAVDMQAAFDRERLSIQAL